MAQTCSQLLAEVPDLADHEVRRLLLLAAGEGAAWMIGDPEVTADTAAKFHEATSAPVPAALK